MGKAVLLLSLVGIAILFTFGLVNPESPVMWLADTSTTFAVIRFTMMIALAILLVTNPPRNMVLRYAVGFFAGILGTWTLQSTYTNSMQLLDSMSILLFSISAGITVLEVEEDPYRVPVNTKKGKTSPAS
jgi:hypothetical protein